MVGKITSQGVYIGAPFRCIDGCSKQDNLMAPSTHRFREIGNSNAGDMLCPGVYIIYEYGSHSKLK